MIRLAKLRQKRLTVAVSRGAAGLLHRLDVRVTAASRLPDPVGGGGQFDLKLKGCALGPARGTVDANQT
jgi:hypothetical protein